MLLGKASMKLRWIKKFLSCLLLTVVSHNWLRGNLLLYTYCLFYGALIYTYTDFLWYKHRVKIHSHFCRKLSAQLYQERIWISLLWMWIAC